MGSELARPEDVTTAAELVEAHRQMKRAAGLSLHEIRRRSKGMLERGYTTCSVSTIGNWTNETTAILPHEGSFDTYRTFLVICGVPETHVLRWWQAVTRVRPVRKEPAPRPAPTATGPTQATGPAAAEPADTGPALAEAATSAPAGPIPDDAVEEALRRWSASLDAQWRDNLERLRFVGPELAVRWRLSAEHDSDLPPEVRPASIAASAGRAEDLINFVEALAHRRVVVSGPSGSGKSVLLLQLAVGLGARARAGAGPYPLLLNSPPPERVTDVRSWLVTQLVLDDPAFGAPCTSRPEASLAEEAVRLGRVLPILDGLDEFGPTPEAHQLLVDVLETWLRADKRNGVVVAQRAAEEPTADSNPLTVPSRSIRINVVPIAKHDALAYLHQHAGGEPWTGILSDVSVLEAMRRPLGVWLATEAYGPARTLRDDADLSRDPTELRGAANAEAVVRLLVERFLPRALGPPVGRWPPRNALRWLATIASSRLVRQDGLLVWWRLADQIPAVVAIALALPGAVAVGIATAVVPRLGVGLGVGVGLAALTAFAVERPWRHAGNEGDPLEQAWGGSGPNLAASIAWGFGGGLLGASLGGAAGTWAGVVNDPFQGYAGALGAGAAAGGVGNRGAAVAGGVVGGVGVALTANTGQGWPAILVDGLTAWFAAALTIARARATRPARRLATPSGRVVLCTAVGAGVAIGVSVGLARGAGLGITAGVLLGLGGGWAAGQGSARITTGGLVADPSTLLAADRRIFLILFLIGGGAFGLGAAAAAHPVVGLAGFVIVGLTAGAVRTAWPAFVVVRLWFAAWGELPLRLMSFLNDAREANVLRPRGAAYAIRHRELADYLLNRSQDSADIEGGDGAGPGAR